MTNPEEFDFRTTPTDNPLVFRRDIVPKGTSDWEIRQALRDKTIERVWWGTYVRVTESDDEDTITRREERYLDMIRAALRTGRPNRFLSHQSAAAMLKIPLLQPDLSTVHFVSRRSGRTSPNLAIHQTDVPDEHLVTIDGTTMTSIGRTVCDVAMTGTPRQALCALDSGLYQASRRNEHIDLDAIASTLRRQHGIATLRAALPFASKGSESIGESLSKCVICENPSIPEPELQVEVTVADGSVKRCDFGWRDAEGRVLVVGEFDGKFKYHRESAASGHRLSEEVIYAEKLREDAIRDCGIIVVRWTWADLRDPVKFAKKIMQALQRAGLVA
ncbi:MULTISPECIES: hypothetical protein [unclassified Gordonia (in: high G+C Gram-positive bacteria)]|uniref:hypothetical protein n=1 Tax=unclassified Gordonia (in: high G+C Gram-positive bacteria) TaxID=2657482 RepID=UPI001F0DCE35|nr:hypothetical protein [Gordonia sp. ABSL49_1]MCH5644896.1 hypothetical protein [Gordonia sp. ABSL49_1]